MAGFAGFYKIESPMPILDNDGLLENLQGPEEIQEKVCSPLEVKWEKDLTEALVEISEKLFDDDQKSVELLIRTEWEEAVCGWGPVSATACLHPQKKQRKIKTKPIIDCLMCLDIFSVSDNKDGTSSETKGSIHTKHKEMSRGQQSPTNTTPAPAEDNLPSAFTGHCPSTAIVSTTETPCDTVNPVSAEEQRHNNKDRKAQRFTSPFTGRALPICTNCYNTKDFLWSSSSMLLPPLKVAAGIGHTEHIARKKAFLMQQFEKLNPKGFPGGSLNSHLNNTDLRAEMRLLETSSELPQDLKVPQSLSFIAPCVPKTPPRKEYDLAQRSRSSLQEMKPNNHPAPMGFLHTRTLPNKCNVCQDDKHRREKSDTTLALRNIVLPSLTVTRLEIPPRIKMC